MIVPLRGGGGVKLPGAVAGALHFELAPETSSHQGPALTIPQATGSRFEIGEFSVKGSVTKEGVAFRAEVRKGALVIVGNEGDGLTGEALPGGETRIEFEFAVVLDEQGARVEGGGRLGATFAINKTFGRVRVQTIAVQVHPKSTPTGSEFRFEASAGMDFDLGPVKVSMDGIGATLGLGVARELPPGGRPLLGALLHVTDIGLQAPKGVGISVASRMVNGGGYLFRDDETGTYGGALQLSIGKRLTLTAVGLLNTRLPDGTKAFSLLLIASLEFMPSIPLFAGIGLRGVGLLGGIHRTVNVDALRSGLRNKTLDAILFPRDPIANAPQIVSALKAVFPPARDRHLFGLMVSLTFLRSVITAELGVIYEFGSKRWVMLGQIQALYPAKPPTGLGRAAAGDARRRRRRVGPGARGVLARRDALRLADRVRLVLRRRGGARAQGRDVPVLGRRLSPRVRGAARVPAPAAGEDQPRRLQAPQAAADGLRGDHLQHAPDRRADGVLRRVRRLQHRGRARLRRAVGARRALPDRLRPRVQAQVQGRHVLRRRRLRPLQRPRAQARQGRVVDRPVADVDLEEVRQDLRRRPPAGRAAPGRSAAGAGGRAQGPAELDRRAARRHARLLPQARGAVRAPAGPARRAPAGAPARDPARPLRRCRAGERAALRHHLGDRRRARGHVATAAQRGLRRGRVPEPERRREARAALVRLHARGRLAVAAARSPSARRWTRR